MPIALEPGARFDRWLSTDADKTETCRPAFVFRYLSGRDWKKLADIIDEVGQSDLGAAAYDRLLDGIRLALADWRNMADPDTGREIPYDPADLDRILNVSDAWELAYGVLGAQRPTADDRKKSESQSPSNTAEPAKAAGPAKKGSGSAGKT